MDGIEIRDEISPALDRAYEALRDPTALLRVVGRAVKLAVQQHLAGLAQDGAFHSTAAGLGAAPTGVYEDAAKSTTMDVSGATATITVHDRRVAQRYFGGIISPINAKSLAIPDTALAYGRSPAAFGGGLKFAFARNAQGRWQACLMLMDASTRDRRRLVGAAKRAGSAAARWAYDQSPVQYWLVNHAIYQPPNPAVMPSEEALRAAVGDAANSYLARQFTAR